MDRVSSKGYAFGYLGCGLLGVLNTAMVLRPGWFGIPSGSMAVRIVFLTVGVWWIGFTVPLMLWVAERRGRVRRRGGILSASFGEAFRTARMIASQRHVLIFLIAFWLYNDGVHAFVMMSADFGMAIGIPASRLALALLAVQFVAFPAALLFGNLARHVGAKNVLLIAVAIYMIVSVVGAMALRTWVQFLVLACVVGCAQGAIQALSRSYYASMVPGDRAAEYFGFYSLVGKFSVVLGPAIVGGMSLFGKRIGLESVTAVRTGIAALGVLFIAGGLLLWRAPTRPAPVEAQCG
jgi:UMF1 family MFS transporter